MPKQSDFFSRNNIISQHDDIDRTQTNDYLEPIRAISRSAYSSIFVINYETQGFDYVSDNPLFLCGNSVDEVMAMGYEFYFKHVPEEDVQFLIKMNEACFEMYHRQPIEDRKKYTLSYDYHLVHKNGNRILVNQKMAVLFLTGEGKVWKVLGIVSLSTASGTGNIKAYKAGENTVLKYNIEEEYWTTEPRIVLSDREKEILTLSARGYSIDQVAKSIFVSADTVKYHRRNLFEKLEVTNISEAILFAVNNKLI